MSDTPPPQSDEPDAGVPVSVRIRERIKQARERFHANDNIARFIEPGELEALQERFRSTKKKLRQHFEVTTAGSGNASISVAQDGVVMHGPHAPSTKARSAPFTMPS